MWPGFPREGESLRARIDSLRGELNAGKKAIASLKAESKKDKESIARISQLVETLNASLASRDRLMAELKGNLKARDEVVTAMGKKLLERFSKPQVHTSDLQTLTLGVPERITSGRCWKPSKKTSALLNRHF